MTTDLKLSNQHDLLIKDGQLVLTSGAHQKAQQVKIALLTFLGEWQFDTTIGVPYLDDVLVKTPNQIKISAVFRQKILEVEGINRLLDFDLSIDRKARALIVEFTAETDQGVIRDQVTLRGNDG